MSNVDQYDIYKVVGKNIRKYRKLKGLTQRALAEELLLSENFISKLESKTYQTISIDTAKQIADILGIKIMYLFDEDILEKEKVSSKN